MDALRRIPLALLAAFAANLLVTIFSLLAGLGHEGLQIILGVDLAAAILMPFGLFVLASRATVREIEMGATLAGAAAAGGALLFIGHMLLRTSDVLRFVMLSVAALEAIGFAVMIGRRSFALAIAELVIVVAGSLAFQILDLPPEIHALRTVLHVAIEFAIVLVVSPPLVPAVLGPPRTGAVDAPALDRQAIEPMPVDNARYVVIAAFVLFLASLCLPSVRMEGFRLFGPKTTQDTLGFACLVYGFFLFPGWLANPLMLVGAIVLGLRRPRAAFIVGCLAIVSALLAPILLFASKLGVEAMLVGFYVWLASIVSFTVAAYLRMRARRLADPLAL